MTREDAITLLKKLRTYHNGTYAKSIDMAIEALQQEPVKHGKWEKTEVAGGSKIYVCSECSEAIYKSTFYENVHYYCNNCGAKMDKERKE